MKTIEEKYAATLIENFDTVKCFREIKEKISGEIINMTYEELCEYLGQTPQKVKLVKNAL